MKITGKIFMAVLVVLALTFILAAVNLIGWINIMGVVKTITERHAPSVRYSAEVESHALLTILSEKEFLLEEREDLPVVVAREIDKIYENLDRMNEIADKYRDVHFLEKSEYTRGLVREYKSYFEQVDSLLSENRKAVNIMRNSGDRLVEIADRMVKEHRDVFKRMIAEGLTGNEVLALMVNYNMDMRILHSAQMLIKNEMSLIAYGNRSYLENFQDQIDILLELCNESLSIPQEKFPNHYSLLKSLMGEIEGYKTAMERWFVNYEKLQGITNRMNSLGSDIQRTAATLQKSGWETMDRGSKQALSRVKVIFLITAFTGLLIFTFGLAFSYIFPRKISEPLKKLVQVTKSVADGDYSQKVEVNTKDEVGELSRAFSTMMGKLSTSRKAAESYSKLLEQMVEERTANLTKSVAELSKARRAVLNILEDMTEANIELKKTKNYLQNLIDSSVDGVVTTDKKGVITFFSRGSEEIMGFKSHQVLNRHVRDFYVGGMEEAVRIMNLLEKWNIIQNYEMELYSSKGEKIPVELSASMLRDDKGNIIGTLGIFRDITEKKELLKKQQELQIKLIQESKMASIGEFAAGIVHNLNNPLTVVLGMSEQLKYKYPEIKDMEKIVTQAEKMIDIISGILNKSKMEQLDKIQPININYVLREELQFLEADMTFKNRIKKEYYFAEDLPEIYGVYSHFSQSFLNIIKNAVDAMYNTGIKILKIKTGYDKDNIYVEISDTGCGISDENIPRLFSPFFSTKPTMAERKGDEPTGTGLGLATVHQLLQPYRAKIEVNSKIGLGTTFKIIVPVDENKKLDNI